LDWTDIIDGLAAFQNSVMNGLCLFFIFAHQGRGEQVASRQNDLALLFGISSYYWSLLFRDLKLDFVFY